MMRKNPRLFRLSATVAIGALLCDPVWPGALAQPAPPAASAAPADQNQADPPARVGRIASQSGAVSFRTSADTQWSAARTNYPVSAGNAFWTEPTALAEVEISASRIDLAGQTELDVTTLSDSGLQAVLPQGELYFHLINLRSNEVWTVDTPRGTVRMTEAGRYDVVAGTTEQPTTVTVLEGSAEIDGPGVSLKIAANQTATVTGAGPTFQGSVGAAVRDAFLSARIAAEHPPARTASIPAQYTYMSGAEDLSGYGEWSQDSDYGQVWYPPVASGWVPYREGEWAYVQPWGWTWVDSDTWGFAPFHYGRWNRIHDRWGWIPGEAGGRDRAVYSPALVAFVGAGIGVAAGAAIASRSVGWVPLGPGEAYHPWYHASSGYLQRINAGHVKDPAAIGATVAPRDFANRGAATSVPASVMLGSRPVRQFARPMSEQTLAAAHPVAVDQLVRPTPRTFGVTPAVARQLNLPAAGAPGAHRPAPGPVVRAQEPGPSHGAPPRPPLLGPHGQPASAPRPGEPAGGPRPGEPARPGAGVPGAGVPGAAGPGRPAGGPPPLEAPGARPPGVPGAGEPRPGGPPEPAGARPPGAEAPRPGGPVPLPAPGARPPGVTEPRGAAPAPEAPRGETPGQHPPEAARPVPEPGREPGNRPGGAPEAHPGAPPAGHESPARPAVEPAHPEPGRPEPAHPEPAHPAPAAPHVEAPAAHPAPPPRPAAPPPHPAAPPPPRPAAPPPPRPAPPPPRPAAPPPPPHAAPPPAPRPAAPPPGKKPGEH